MKRLIIILLAIILMAPTMAQGAWTNLVTVTPTVGAALFAANDVVGGKLTIAGAVRLPAGASNLQTLSLVDAAKQNAALKIFIFNSALAGSYADNAAEAVTAADWLKCIGFLTVAAGEYQTMANASVVSQTGIAMPVKLASGSSLYALIVTTGTPTYTANALQLIFGFGE